MSGRLPDDAYPPGLGPYPNPANEKLRCMSCGAREGEPHDDPLRLCPGGEAHVSYLRAAYEHGCRRAAALERRFLDIIEGNPARRKS